MDQLMRVERPCASTTRMPYVVTYRGHVLRYWVHLTLRHTSRELRWIVVFAGNGNKTRLDQHFRDRSEAHAAALDWIRCAIDRFAVRTDSADH